jgi:hypothetical protein
MALHPQPRRATLPLPRCGWLPHKAAAHLHSPPVILTARFDGTGIRHL